MVNIGGCKKSTPPERRKAALRKPLRYNTLISWRNDGTRRRGFVGLPSSVQARQANHVLRHGRGVLHVRGHLIISELVVRFPGRQQDEDPFDRIGRSRDQRPDL